MQGKGRGSRKGEGNVITEIKKTGKKNDRGKMASEGFREESKRSKIQKG